MGIKDKFLDFMGIEDADEKEEPNVMAEEEETAEPVHPKAESVKKTLREPRLQGGGDPISMPNSTQQKMIVYYPVSYDDAQSIIDNLKARKPVIVNMEDLEVATAQRILDFLSGASYGLNGTIRKISRNIFVVAPANYDVVGNNGSDGEYMDM